MAAGLLEFALLAAVICVAVRYLMPVVMTALVDPLCGVVGIVAALLVLPEYWVSAAFRRNGGGPPHLAYLYGDGVCRLARMGHRGVRLTLRSLAVAAHTIPPVGVVIIVGTWQLVRVLP